MSYNIICAASDTPEELKKKADFICDSTDARPVLQSAIDEASRLGVNCILLQGTYEINSCGKYSKNGAICFYNSEPEQRFYSQNKAHYHVLEGARIPLGYLDGAIIKIGTEFYNSLSDNIPFSLFYTDGNSPFGRGMIIKNLVVQLPSSNKPVIVFDGSAASAVRYEDCWVTSFDPCKVNLATAEGISVPHPESVAFRGCCGSNFYATEWKNLAAQGFGIGFDIGGEHVYCESLSALYNIYGFRFDCYKGKKEFDSSSDRAFGVCVYPTTCINLLDEHNVNLPLFGNASHNGKTRDGWHKSISILGMNIQWPNTCPGYTDRSSPTFSEGRSRAIESQKGSWHGSIEYVIDHTTESGGVNICSEPFFEEGNGTCIITKNIISENT